MLRREDEPQSEDDYTEEADADESGQYDPGTPRSDEATSEELQP